MTHSFPFEQFQRDTRLRRRGDHGCLAVRGKKADETPGTKEMRQGLWGAQAVTCIVLLLSFSPFLLVLVCSYIPSVSPFPSIPLSLSSLSSSPLLSLSLITKASVFVSLCPVSPLVFFAVSFSVSYY